MRGVAGRGRAGQGRVGEKEAFHTITIVGHYIVDGIVVSCCTLVGMGL
jgi:hypothetical protein